VCKVLRSACMCACLLVYLSAHISQKPHMRTSCTLSVTPACCCWHGMFYFAIEIVPYMVFISVAVSYGNVSASVGSAVKSRPTTAVASATNGTVFRLICTFVSFLYHIYLISLSSNGLIDVDLCHTYMMISYCLFAMLVVSHYLQVVCRNHNPSFFVCFSCVLTFFYSHSRSVQCSSPISEADSPQVTSIAVGCRNFYQAHCHLLNFSASPPWPIPIYVYQFMSYTVCWTEAHVCMRLGNGRCMTVNAKDQTSDDF